MRVPIAAIRFVMADTDLTPFDAGHVRQRDDAPHAPQLRRVAATAREVLIDMAAKRLAVDRASLTVSDGKIVHAASQRSVSFGELAKDKQFTEDGSACDAALTPPPNGRSRGHRFPRSKAAAIVTGKHRYASDIRLPGMLFGKMLRPPSLNATLKSVNLKGAQALPGVTVVHDGSFIGVAAPTAPLAEEALAAIHAEWTAPEKPASDRRYSRT